MKYKINIFKCLWGSYKDTKRAFADNTVETDTFALICGNIFYYLCSIIFLPIFLIISLIWFFKRIIRLKKGKFTEIQLKALKQQKYIKEVEDEGNKV